MHQSRTQALIRRGLIPLAGIRPPGSIQRKVAETVQQFRYTTSRRVPILGSTVIFPAAESQDSAWVCGLHKDALPALLLDDALYQPISARSPV